jgi:hypothetical protein
VDPQRQQKISTTMTEKYGVPNAALSPAIQGKKTQAVREKYGVDHVSKSEEIKAKKKQTMLDRWGVENPSQNPLIQQRKIVTNLARYGVDWAVSSDEIKHKQKQTNLSRYGSTSSLANCDVREKGRITMLKKYGVEHPLQDPRIKSQMMQTNILKYGVKYSCQRPEIREKVQNTNFSRYGKRSWRASDIGKKALEDLHMAKRGFTNPAKDPLVIAKIKETMKMTYGVIHNNYIGMDQSTIDILRNPELFASFVKGLTIHQAAEKLNVHDSSIYRLSILYKCRDLMNISDNSYELKIIQLLNELNITYERHNRTIISPQEIDIWLPDYNIAIEVGSLYWHGESTGRGKYYHYAKWKKCHDKGIQLFQWFDEDLFSNWEITKSRLSRSLQIPTSVVGGRKCEIGYCSVTEERQFLNKWHSKGFSHNRNHVLCARYHNEIIAIMTFHEKDNHAYMDRWATNINYSFPGLFSKTTAHWIKSINFTGLISTWSDNRLGNGRVYEASGFDLTRTSPPGYWYFKDSGLEHRLKYQKHKLSQIFDIDTTNMSEWQVMQSQGYDRIWDAGHTLWCKQV